MEEVEPSFQVIIGLESPKTSLSRHDEGLSPIPIKSKSDPVQSPRLTEVFREIQWTNQIPKKSKSIPAQFPRPTAITTNGSHDIQNSYRYLVKNAKGDAFPMSIGKIANKFQVILTEIVIRGIQNPNFNAALWTPPTDLFEMNKAAFKEIQSQKNLRQKLHSSLLVLFSAWNIDTSELDMLSAIPQQLYLTSGDKREKSGVLGVIISEMAPMANENAAVVYIGTYFYINSLYQEYKRCSFDLTEPSLQIPNPLFYGFVADVLYPLVEIKEKSFVELFKACNIIFRKEEQTDYNVYLKKLTQKIRKNAAFTFIPERVDRDYSNSLKGTFWSGETLEKMN